jgi:AcrR family transcriptional regulator
LRAAQELIEEGGYGAASVIAITTRAGLAAGTLYRHFRSKEELFAEVFRSVCDRELAAMRRAATDEAVPHTERLQSVLSTFTARALRRPRLAWALLAEPVDPLVDAAALVGAWGEALVGPLSRHDQGASAAELLESLKGFSLRAVGARQ